MAKRPALITAKATETKVPAADGTVTVLHNQQPEQKVADPAAAVAAAMAISDPVRTLAWTYADKFAADKEFNRHLRVTGDAAEDLKRSAVQMMLDAERIHGRDTIAAKWPRLWRVTDANKDVKRPWRYDLPNAPGKNEGDFYVDVLSKTEDMMFCEYHLSEIAKAANGAADTIDAYRHLMGKSKAEIKAEKAPFQSRKSTLTSKFKNGMLLFWELRDIEKNLPGIGWEVRDGKDRDGKAIIPIVAFSIWDDTSAAAAKTYNNSFTAGQMLNMSVEQALAKKAADPKLSDYTALCLTLERAVQTPDTAKPATVGVMIDKMDTYTNGQLSYAHFYTNEGAARVVAHANKLKGTEQEDFTDAFQTVYYGMMAAWEGGLKDLQAANATAKSIRVAADKAQQNSVAMKPAATGKAS